MNVQALDRILREIDARTVLFAIVALFLIFVFAGFQYGIKPAYAEYSSVRDEHQLAMESRAEADAEGTDSISSLELEISRLQHELYGDSANVPREETEAFVVDALARLSGRHGVQFRGIKPEAPANILMFEEWPYTVKVEGAYFAVHRWLYDVEEELRPMVVKQFQLSPSSDPDSVSLDLRIVAYRAIGEAGT